MQHSAGRAEGYPRRWLAETGSTNDVAREWALSGAPDGAMVVAGCQASGRGRRERKWDSPAGLGLYASVVLRPEWPASEASGLAIVAGMATYWALEAAGVGALRIKWPNDVLAGGKKIGGVLVEPRIGGGRFEFAGAGVGINLRHQKGDFPGELASRATSCRMEGVEATAEGMADRLCEGLRRAREMEFGALRAEWIEAGAREEEPEI